MSTSSSLPSIYTAFTFNDGEATTFWQSGQHVCSAAMSLMSTGGWVAPEPSAQVLTAANEEEALS
jgi:hypothetical protein